MAADLRLMTGSHRPVLQVLFLTGRQDISSSCWLVRYCPGHSKNRTKTIVYRMQCVWGGHLSDHILSTTGQAEPTCRKLSWQQRKSFFFMMASVVKVSSFLLRAGSFWHGYTAWAQEEYGVTYAWWGERESTRRRNLLDRHKTTQWSFSNLWLFANELWLQFSCENDKLICCLVGLRRYGVARAGLKLTI